MSGTVPSISSPSVTTATTAALSGLSNTPATTQVGAQANDPQMNEFLTLLVAQLQNQDPMNPTDPAAATQPTCWIATGWRRRRTDSTPAMIADRLIIAITNSPARSVTSSYSGGRRGV